MRSVRLGNIIVCKHVFENYAKRFPCDNMDFSKNDNCVIIAKVIKKLVDESIKVDRESSRGIDTIFIHVPLSIAFPASISSNTIRIVTCYRAGRGLMDKAKLQYLVSDISNVSSS